jgi:flagellar biosynthetic protein FliP
MKRARSKKQLILLFLALLSLTLTACAGSDALEAPGVTLTVDPAGEPKQVSSGVQLLAIMTVLSLAPSIMILATSFTRIVIVLSLLRSAIGTPQVPPNQVVIGLALLLTFFIMTPVYNQMNSQAIQPYLNGEMEQKDAFEQGMAPLRQFMFSQTREKDLELFIAMSGQEAPQSLKDIPTVTLLPAFVISELRSAFIMGFAIYVPFLVIDLVISSVLLAMGMMMLPPSLISLPFKLLLFVMVDGWYLIVRSLSMSFM